MDVSELVGKKVSLVWALPEDDPHPDTLLFFVENKIYALYHAQDCCESVYLEDIEGDLNDLIGAPLIMAYESSSDPASGATDYSDDFAEEDDLEKWTFYRFMTAKGDVVLRWYGTSNGYYSVDVDVKEVDPDELDRWL